MEDAFESHDLDITALAIIRSTDLRGQIDLERLLARLLLSTSRVLRNGLIVFSESARVELVSQMMLKEKHGLMQDYPCGWQKRYQYFLQHYILYIITMMIQQQARYLYNTPTTHILWESRHVISCQISIRLQLNLVARTMRRANSTAFADMSPMFHRLVHLIL